jgi:hypothetical protein
MCRYYREKLKIEYGNQEEMDVIRGDYLQGMKFPIVLLLYC